MKRVFVHLLIIAALLIAAILVVDSPLAAGNDDEVIIGANTDNPSHPLGDEQAARKEVRFPPS